MIWFSLLIPVAVSLAFLFFFKKQIAWWELLLPSLISLVIVFAIYELSIYGQTSDTQYLGDLIVKCEYYEPWETYVHRTCSETVCDSRDKNGSCTSSHTRYYDCSYCDYTSEKYYAYTSTGKCISISEHKFYELKARWGGQWTFHDMQRDIDFYGSCGKDGDMYYISWDRNQATAEPCIWEESYENKVQAANSAFTYTDKVDPKGLYDYPPIYDQYKQISVLGIDSIGLCAADIQKIEKQFEFFNAYYGPRKKVHFFLIVYRDKSPSIAKRQEIYWKGGNQNEVTLCIGIDPKTNQVLWSRAFSWCFNHRILVDLREDISDMGTLNFDSVYVAAERTIVQNYAVTIFKKEFAYLKVKPSSSAVTWAYILTIIITLGINIWSVMNQFTEEDPDGSGSYRSVVNKYKSYGNFRVGRSN